MKPVSGVLFEWKMKPALAFAPTRPVTVASMYWLAVNVSADAIEYCHSEAVAFV